MRFEQLHNKTYLQCFYCGRKNSLRAYLYYYTGFFRMRYYKFTEDNTGKTRVCCSDCRHGRINIKRCIFKYL